MSVRSDLLHLLVEARMMSTSLWLVDDDEGLRGDLAAALRVAAEDVSLTGAFATSEAALAAAERGDPFDVVLIDLGLPGSSGERVIRRLRELRPSAPLLALTMRSDDEAVFSTLRAGAHGYLTKDMPIGDLIAAVREARRGGAPLGPRVSMRVVSRFWEVPQDRGLAKLTPREHQVLEFLCTGVTYRQAGDLLGIAEGTIQTHVKRIYEKLHVSNKAEAVRLALEAGLTLR